ncbi:MAG: DEAD/DEAH box helicase [Burkholderiaceae bacterium]
MELRQYQQAALSAGLQSLGRGNNPVLQLATGTGKSIIIAALLEHARRAGQNAWALTHVQQLVTQNAAAYRRYAQREPGVVCAALNRKDAQSGPVYGTIQSMSGMLERMPPPHLIVIDEAHRVPHNVGEPTLYEGVLRRYPAAQRLAMTATPWRMDNGVIYGQGEEFWFNDLAFNYPVPRAVEDGWLSPLVGVETEVQLDVEDLGVQSGDFVQSEADALQTERWLGAVSRSLLQLAAGRRHLAVYSPTIQAAQRAAQIIEQVTGWPTATLHSQLTPPERDATLRDYYAGHTRVLCSVDMITTGFDFPALDCIVCLRPTLSSSLWVQIQGRGTRLAEGKKNCLVLDYVGNLLRLGGVDMYDTYYRQKNAEAVEARPLRPYVPRERKVYPGVRTLTPIDPMTGRDVRDGGELTVTVHGANAVALNTRGKTYPLLMVQYACTTAEGARIDASCFINTEAPDSQALKFFNDRRLAVRLPAPARALAWQLKACAHPRSLRVRKRGRYWNVIEEQFGDVQA